MLPYARKATAFPAFPNFNTTHQTNELLFPACLRPDTRDPPHRITRKGRKKNTVDDEKKKILSRTSTRKHYNEHLAGGPAQRSQRRRSVVDDGETGSPPMLSAHDRDDTVERCSEVKRPAALLKLGLRRLCAYPLP